MPFTDSSVIVLTDIGTVHDFQSSVSSPYAITFPSGSTGTWSWVVSREGYHVQGGIFDASAGGLSIGSSVSIVRLRADGTNMYTGTSDANLNVVFDLAPLGAERCYIDIGNSVVSPQAVLDEVEVALTTQDGCRFLGVSDLSEITYATAGAESFLFLGTGYRIRRATPGDSDAAVSAVCESVDGTVVDDSNGDVALLSVSTSCNDIIQALTDYGVDTLTNVKAAVSI